jgi:hypothetical protein
MSNTIISLLSSGETGNTPLVSNLANGELALNYADGILFFKNTEGNLGQIKTTEPAGLDGELQFNDSGVLGSNSSLSFDKTTGVLSTTNVTSESIATNTYIQFSDGTKQYTANAGSSGSSVDQLARDTANGAFTKANNALANTSGTIFNGEFSIGNGGKLTILPVGGDEGGEILLGKPPNSTLDGGITIDAYQNKIRIFEQGGSARGVYIDLTEAAGGVGTNLLSGGGGGTLDQYARTTANAAFDKANSANVLAQSAFNTANSSTTVAGAAFDAANSSTTVAGAAFDKANSANVLAQSSFDAANSSGVIAGAAFDKANSANVLAQSSFDAANSSGVIAGAAFDKANSANVLAQSAFNTANGAQEIANRVEVNAGGAFDKANSANVLAQSAFNTANSSTVIAGAAFDTANSFGVIAGAAFDKANSANVLAQSAFNTANSSTTVADAAFGTANSANVLAQSAFNTANTSTVIAGAAFDKANSSTTIAVAAFDAANTKTYTFEQNTAPATANSADSWVHSETGVSYHNFGNTTNPIWAEVGPTGLASNTTPGSFSTTELTVGLFSSNIIPSADVTYDLGSDTNRWRDLYLSGSTINLGGAVIKTDAGSGAIALLPQPTLENPNPSGVVVSPTGGISVVETTGGEIAAGAIEEAATSPTAAPVPIDITTTAPQAGQTLVWNSSGSKFIPGNASGGSGAGVTVYANTSILPLANVGPGSMAFVESNNRLYLWNGVGWFNIALINTNPNITGGADSSYVFATDGTPIVLTLIASDPEGIPLTWSYEVTSGVLGNTATVSQANNVFTITPSTDDADGGQFQLTFSASDGVNIGTAASSFSLVFGAADPYYKQSVLLTTTGINNGTNNTFIDSSTNNFTVTRNGNATQGAFGPFSPAGWSGYFDGTGDYLTVPYSTSAFDWWTDNYTIEAWVYPTSFTGWSYLDGANIKPTLIGNAAFNSTTNYWGFGLTTTGIVYFAYFNGSAQGAGTSATANLNAWNHIALVKNGTNVTLYLNGVGTSIGNVSGTPQSATGTPLTIGAANNAYINGYVSNLRIVKGTAVYTTNFSTPTNPLTAVAGTSLLTLQSNRFVDNSVNNFAITRNGDTRVTPFSPFDPLTAYDTSVNGGSAYFDGTGDYLTVADNAALELGSSDFTIEAWVYPTSASANSIITKRVNNSVYGGYGLFLTSNTLAFVADNDASGDWAIAMVSGSAVPLNVWSHVAVTRNGSTWTTWVNGVQSQTVTSSITINDQATSLAVGAISDGSATFFGYISNARVVKGTAVYTSNFTPPTAPVTAVSGTSLLLNTINANIYDQTGKVVAETLGDAKTSTAVVKYGTTSMAFDGTGDYLRVPASTELDFGTGDFTIETWVNFTALSSNRVLLDRWVTGNANAWQLYWRSTGTSITFLTGSSTILVQDPNGSNITTGTWNHIAVTRSGTTVRLFVNGIVVATNTSSVSFTNTLPLGVGIQTSTTTNPFNGYLSDTRITKGVARYTVDFTPPTAQLGFNNAE